MEAVMSPSGSKLRLNVVDTVLDVLDARVFDSTSGIESSNELVSVFYFKYFEDVIIPEVSEAVDAEVAESLQLYTSGDGFAIQIPQIINRKIHRIFRPDQWYRFLDRYVGPIAENFWIKLSRNSRINLYIENPLTDIFSIGFNRFIIHETDLFDRLFDSCLIELKRVYKDISRLPEIPPKVIKTIIAAYYRRRFGIEYIGLLKDILNRKKNPKKGTPEHYLSKHVDDYSYFCTSNGLSYQEAYSTCLKSLNNVKSSIYDGVDIVPGVDLEEIHHRNTLNNGHGVHFIIPRVDPVREHARKVPEYPHNDLAERFAPVMEVYSVIYGHLVNGSKDSKGSRFDTFVPIERIEHTAQNCSKLIVDFYTKYTKPLEEQFLDSGHRDSEYFSWLYIEASNVLAAGGLQNNDSGYYNRLCKQSFIEKYGVDHIDGLANATERFINALVTELLPAINTEMQSFWEVVNMWLRKIEGLSVNWLTDNAVELVAESLEEDNPNILSSPRFYRTQNKVLDKLF